MLRYPAEVQSGDFITLTPHEYRSNARGTNGPAVGPPIILYMPNSTPAMQNGQRWEKASFVGPFGEMKRDVAEAVVAGATRGIGDGPTGRTGIIDGLKEVGSNIGKIPDAIRQGIISETAKIAGTSAQGIMAFSRGEIFNPNIELLYEGPGLRSFGLNFSFIPKDEMEAATVSQIILNLKVWSTPEDNGAKYKIPAVWDIKYGGAGGTWMNRFKRAACTNIGVAYNQGLDMHATFSNGYPLRTDLQLNFHEVDVITRRDHQQNPTGAGF